MAHAIEKEQRPLISLIVVMTLIHVGTVVSNLVGIPDIFLEYNLYPAGLTATVKNFPNGFDQVLNTITYAFLHADVMHLGYNMIFLWIFGGLIAELVGARWVLALFFLTAIAGAAGHTALNPDSMIPTLGASGAVAGMQGAYLAMVVRWILPDPRIWPIASPIPPTNLVAVALIGFASDYAGIMNHEQGIAFGAHLGGLIMGMALGSFALPRPPWRQRTVMV